MLLQILQSFGDLDFSKYFFSKTACV